MAEAAIALSGLARHLVRDGILDEAVARDALNKANKKKRHFVSYIVEEKLADAQAVARVASEEFGSPLFDIKSLAPDAIPNDLVDSKLIQRHHALPLFKRGKRLYLGIADPTNLRALDEIKFHTGLNTDSIIVDEVSLTEAITKHLEQIEEPLGAGLTDLDDDGLDNLDVETVDPNAEDEDAGTGLDDAPVVRYRTDGILQEVAAPPIAIGSRLAARLKVMSQMDISERRRPQDGRIKMKLSKSRAIDFRVNSLPTLWGEKVVLRILDPSSAQMGIEHLGYEPEQQKMFEEALSEPQGMILVTGPTGSGKTVSLYTGLNILNTPELNISTAEDPVEINLEGINQVHVNPKVGLTFAEALRSFIRQDPDIVMVGEIRDLETAEIAVKAAQTGHLVLSTLHTNSAAETVTRLLNMGIPSFNVATSVTLIIAQRLARRLCNECAAPADLPREALEEAGFTEKQIQSGKIRKPVGCPKCSRGYKGRVGIYEVVRITEKIADIIMEGGNSLAISKQARAEGFADLRRSALKKCADGVTSLEEVNRVTRD